MSHETAIARRQVEITNRLGLRLRAAGQFVGIARRFQCEIRVHYQGNQCNGKSILDLATLAAECGTRLDLEACGPRRGFGRRGAGHRGRGSILPGRERTGALLMMSDPSQVIVTIEDFAFHSVHSLAVHHRDFPRSGAKATPLRMPPHALPNGCYGPSTVHRATGAGSTSARHRGCPSVREARLLGTRMRSLCHPASGPGEPIMIAQLMKHCGSQSERLAARLVPTSRAQSIIGMRLKHIDNPSFDDPTVREAILAPLTDSADDQVSRRLRPSSGSLLAGKPMRSAVVVSRAGGPPVPQDELSGMPPSQLREKLNPAWADRGDLDEIELLECESWRSSTGSSRCTYGWSSRSPGSVPRSVTTCANVSATAISRWFGRWVARFRQGQSVQHLRDAGDPERAHAERVENHASPRSPVRPR